MPIIAKDSTGDKFPKLPLPEAGTTQAVCCAVWDLGNQVTPYENEDGTPKVQHKVIIAWEISEKINAPESEYHGKPYMLNRKYTLSLSDKANLRKDLEAWRGKQFTGEELAGFNLSKLLKAPCQLTVVHEQGKNGSTYANIKAIAPLAKGMQAPPECANEPVMYDISEGIGGAFQKFSDKLKETIAACQEWQGKGAVSSEAPGSDQKPGATEDEDNIPF